MSKGEGPEPPQPFRPIRWWMVLLGVAAVAVMTGVAWVLLTHASRGVTDAAEVAKLRVEVIRTVLTVGAGTGGAMALLLAVRRQWLNERDQLHREHVADDNRYDAAERRITDLYVKAAEQLGSDKAPVRLAGLYALERLAQDTPEHRQTIVEVICAYLRMPYTPLAERDATTESAVSQDQAESATDKKPDTGYDPHEERQVRLAAQRILARHLQPAETSKFWPDIDIDLSGTILIDFDFAGCTVRDADFGATTFTGDTKFFCTAFRGDVRFDRAGFGGEARFDGAGFDGEAWFDGAGFDGEAWFDDVSFGRVSFGEASFGDVVSFYKVSFRRARFGGASFGKAVWFYKASFGGEAVFSKAFFNGSVTFDNARFGGEAWFGTATFRSAAGFHEATFNRAAVFDRASFDGPVQFDEATFRSDAGFGKATFRSAAWFDEARFYELARFGGVSFEGLAQFGKVAFNGGFWFVGATLCGNPVDVNDF